MALKATVFKAELQVSDVDRGYYDTHALTLARHPSETDERMMVRMLAYALHADVALTFAGDVAAEDEPGLWRRDLTGAIEQWIEVGMPESRVLRRAAGRSREVYVHAYGRGVELWWAGARAELVALPALTVWRIAPSSSQALAAMAQRSMRLQCLIQDGDIIFSDESRLVTVERTRLHPGAG